jgi:hypothetical protein
MLMLERTRSRLWKFSVALLLLSLPAGAYAQAGIVTGKITDEAGGPVPAVRVVVVGTTLEVQSPPSGEYRITGVPSGRVVVRAFKLGFKSVIDTISLAPGGTATANFKMVESLV